MSDIRMTRISHIGLKVRNLEKAVRFYEGFGFRPTGPVWGPNTSSLIKHGAAFMRLGEDHQTVVLFPVPGAEADTGDTPPLIGMEHFALQVEELEDFLFVLAHIKKEGIRVVRGPILHGPLPEPSGDDFAAGSGSLSIYILDPDGHKIEIHYGFTQIKDEGRYMKALRALGMLPAGKAEATDETRVVQAA